MFTKKLIKATNSGLELGLVHSNGTFPYRYKFKTKKEAQNFRKKCKVYTQESQQGLMNNAHKYYQSVYNQGLV